MYWNQFSPSASDIQMLHASVSVKSPSPGISFVATLLILFIYLLFNYLLRTQTFAVYFDFRWITVIISFFIISSLSSCMYSSVVYLYLQQQIIQYIGFMSLWCEKSITLGYRPLWSEWSKLLMVKWWLCVLDSLFGFQKDKTHCFQNNVTTQCLSVSWEGRMELFIVFSRQIITVRYDIHTFPLGQVKGSRWD